MKMTISDNIFDKCSITPPATEQEQGREVFQTILTHAVSQGDTVRLERIMSFATENGEWYDQAWDEWVMMVRGTATMEWEDGSVTELEVGDYLLIKAQRRHRVLRTSFDCVWLALHLGGADA